jgi:hypothetical protein
LTGDGTSGSPLDIAQNGATNGQVLTWNGSAWVPQSSAAGWGLTGNTGTSPSTNFIGTSDNVDFVLRTNNTERARITSGGLVGVGTTPTTAKLQISDATTTSNFAGLRVDQTAANSGTGYGIYATKTGASTTNVGGYFSASGATNNYGLVVASGNVGIGNTAPTQPLDVTGNVRFSGALMPNGTAGTSGQVLQSNGAGNAPTWINPQVLGGSYGNTFVPSNPQFPYTASSNDFAIIISVANATVNLPDISTVPNKVYYICLNAGISQAYITAATGQTISGTTDQQTVTLQSGNGQGAFSGVLLINDGNSKWFIVTTRRSG